MIRLYYHIKKGAFRREKKKNFMQCLHENGVTRYFAIPLHDFSYYMVRLLGFNYVFRANKEMLAVVISAC